MLPKPLSSRDIPEMTSLVARAAFPKGNLYMRLRDELGTLYTDQVGHDGFMLLDALAGSNVATELTRLPSTDTLRQVWERHYERTEEGKARWRAGPELSRAATAIESPYDVEARHSSKRDTVWTGYKAHLSETCDADLPRLITNVHTTVATTQDVSCTEDIHQGLKHKELLPGVHLIDAGYVDAHLLVQSTDQHGVTLLGPPRSDKSWQAREGGYDQSRFAIDWQRQKVTCPEGKTSLWWGAQSTSVDGGDDVDGWARTHPGALFPARLRPLPQSI